MEIRILPRAVHWFFRATKSLTEDLVGDNRFSTDAWGKSCEKAGLSPFGMKEDVLGPRWEQARRRVLTIFLFDRCEVKVNAERLGLSFWGSKGYVETKKESGMAGF